MAVEIKPVSTIKANLGIDVDGRVQKFFTNACRRYMDKYVPMDKGNLRTIVNVQQNTITYQSQYARYQYYGVREDGTRQVQRYTTPGTGTYWDKKMVSAELKDVIKETEDFMKGK